VKKGILVALVVLGLVMGICLSGLAGASTTCTGQVLPLVRVESGGGLSITGGTTGAANAIDFGNMGPGQTPDKTLSLGITANNAWHLTVSKNQDLSDSQICATIPSANFTFKSNGDSGPIYVTSSTEFGNLGSASNVVTNGSATSDCNVNVVYRLIIPANQPTGYYTAAHTYTLIVGSP